MNILKKIIGFILSLFSILCMFYYIYIMIYDFIVCRRIFYISETTGQGYLCHNILETEFAWKIPVVIVLFITGRILIKQSVRDK